MSAKVSLKQGNYTWVPKLVAPRESQWSILCKFAAWNALTVKKLNYLVGLRKASYHPINLALAKYIDAERFTKLTGSSVDQINESLAINYVPEGWGKSLICTSLRYCPACLRQGYHSAIYQVGLITNCPIHGTSLLDYCDQCGQKIDIAKPRNNIDNPYVCNCCGEVFCDILNIGIMNPLSKDEISKINKIGVELQALVDETQKRRVYWGKGQSMTESIGLTYSIYAQCLEEVYKHAGNISIKDAINISRNIDWDITRAKPLISLWVTYRAIRRRIRRTVLRHHRSCLNTMRLLGGAYAGFTFDGPLGCVPTHAFIMWRMYWEGHMNIANLNLDQKVPIEWNHSDVMSDKEAIHVFGHDCIASFYLLCNKAQELELDENFHLMTRDEIDILKNDGLFLKNWVIAEGAGSKTGKPSNVFTWFDRCSGQLFQKENHQHRQALSETRDKIYDAIKAARFGKRERCDHGIS